jgi:hypothetical protein
MTARNATSADQILQLDASPNHLHKDEKFRKSNIHAYANWYRDSLGLDLEKLRQGMVGVLVTRTSKLSRTGPIRRPR